MNEIEILQKLKNNPNIINLYNYKKYRNTYKLIFEYIDTKTLETYIKNIKSKSSINLELKEKLYFTNLFIVYQLLKGVSFIHEEGILHLDLKPANLLISYINTNPILKIADFGISQYREKATNDINNGTVFYFYPTDNSSVKYNIKFDKWAFGLIVYELFSPYRGPLYQELFPTAENKANLVWLLMQKNIEDYKNIIKEKENINKTIKNIIISLFNNVKLSVILYFIYENLNDTYKNIIKKMYKEKTNKSKLLDILSAPKKKKI